MGEEPYNRLVNDVHLLCGIVHVQLWTQLLSDSLADIALDSPENGISFPHVPPRPEHIASQDGMKVTFSGLSSAVGSSQSRRPGQRYAPEQAG
jgi:hypothetical protein